ncbi:MAG TPA: hypothetical protein VMZ25_07780 [Terriglobales bacterium]|nr:hypothetical protein [Terriglobales bacterium]
MSISVLSAGRDLSLLTKRSEVLSQLGCSVTPVVNSADLVNTFFDGDYDLIVICSSIPPDERRKILMLVKHYRPTMHAILVSDFADQSSAYELPSLGVRVAPEPTALIHAVSRSFPELPRPI